MRTVYLLRHAKSSWDDSTLADHDRPLAPRGSNAVPLVADHMRSEGVVPEVVLCSTARRTRQTLALLGDAIAADSDLRIESDLYSASADTLVARLRELHDTVERVLVIGHNPGLERLVWLLTRDRPAKFPTAALATLDATIDRWIDLKPGSAQLTDFVRPRDLDASR